MNMEDYSNLTEAELLQRAADAQGIADSARHELKRRRLEARRSLAVFMSNHRDEFVSFFALGGCTRPEDAVDRLILEPENWRPMAYVQKEEA